MRSTIVLRFHLKHDIDLHPNELATALLDTFHAESRGRHLEVRHKDIEIVGVTRMANLYTMIGVTPDA